MAGTVSLKRRTRRLSLAFMGEGWHDAYVDVRRATIADSLEIDEIMKRDAGMKGLLEVIKFLFESGKGLSESGHVLDLTPDHLDSLDGDAILAMTSQVTLGESADPKALMNSEPTTPEPATSPSDSTSSNTEPSLDAESTTSSESPSKSSTTGEQTETSEPNS